MTSREQFEEIYMKREPEASMAFNENVGRYKYAFIQSQYEFFLEAWKASREAVEVEIPTAEPDRGSDSQVDISAGFSNRMRSKCIESIRAAGIKIKGE